MVENAPGLNNYWGGIVTVVLVVVVYIVIRMLQKR